MGDPLAEGALQVTLISLPNWVVVGASGISGTVAHRMLKT